MQSPQPPVYYPPPRPRRRGLKVTLSILLLLLVAAAFLLGRTGLVPGLSRLTGADKPRDLGVQPTPAHFANVVKDLGYQLQNVPSAANPDGYRKVYSGQVKVDRPLTEEELSALLTYNHVTWWPIQNAQIKVHADGVMEASFGAVTRNIPFDQMPSSVLRHLPSALPDVVPVYLKGRIAVVNPTQVRLELERFELGRVPLPAGVLSAENQQRATDYVNDRIRNIPGLTIQSLTFAEGKVRFQGTFPKSFQRVPAGQ